MDLTFAVYNAEWMKDLFDTDGTPRRHDQGSDTLRAHGERSRKLAEVVRALDADVLCIVEGPDTLADGSKTASQQLLAWRDLHGLDPDYEAVQGITSPGQQELCALYRASKVTLASCPDFFRFWMTSCSEPPSTSSMAK